LQFWGSLLQLTPHAHNWIPDGVFYYQQDDTLAFQPLDPPDDLTVQALADKLYARVAKACALDDPDDDGAPADDEQALLAAFQAEAAELPKSSAARPLFLDEPSSASSGGLSLHIGLPTPAGDAKELAHRLGYAMRPPIAQKRLAETPAGMFRLKLRRPLSDGRTALLFEPFALLRRLVAIIAPPGFNLTRYFGIFANRHAARADLAPLLPQPEKPAPQQDEQPDNSNDSTTDPDPDTAPDADPADEKSTSSAWAQRLARTLGIHALSCPNCGGKMRVIALIEERAVIVKILSHLGLPTERPKLAPARAPPQLELFNDDCAGCDDELPVIDAAA
jgi:hypothetical protein